MSMRAARLSELEEMAGRLLETASKLPPGEDRYNALQEIARFRMRIMGLRRHYLRTGRQRLQAKGK
jgi:hypothetical protein